MKNIQQNVISNLSSFQSQCTYRSSVSDASKRFSLFSCVDIPTYPHIVQITLLLAVELHDLVTRVIGVEITADDVPSSEQLADIWKTIEVDAIA